MMTFLENIHDISFPQITHDEVNIYTSYLTKEGQLYDTLTHWGRDKMAATSQTMF